MLYKYIQYGLAITPKFLSKYLLITTSFQIYKMESVSDKEEIKRKNQNISFRFQMEPEEQKSLKGKILSQKKSPETTIIKEEGKLKKEEITVFLKKYFNLIVYILLAIIVFISTKIRTKNLSGLKDITTGGFSLINDIDIYLFVRYATDIINGQLFPIDMMRYAPIGFVTKRELLLHPHLIAWFHKIASFFGSESVMQSAAIYPVVMFALTVIVFFFLTRKIFTPIIGHEKSSIIALLSSLFISISPSILGRTIAGVPEKEAAAFFFIFLTFYLFLSGWYARPFKKQFLLAILAGLSFSISALLWAGFAFLSISIATAVTIAFFIGQVSRKRFYFFSTFLLLTTIILLKNPFTIRYSFSKIMEFAYLGTFFFVFLVLLTHFIFTTKFETYIKRTKLSKIPKPIISLLLSIFFAFILSLILFGPSFIPDFFGKIVSSLTAPVTTRIGQTIQENLPSYFLDWSPLLAPLKNIPIFFYLFFIGSIYLFFIFLKPFKKKGRILITFAFTFLMCSITLSRYSPESIFNGVTTISNLFYISGFGLFLVVLGYYYWKNRQELEKMNFSLLLLFLFFIVSLIAARGAVRFLMVLIFPASIIVSFLTVSAYLDSRKIKESFWKKAAKLISILLIILTLFSLVSFYKLSNEKASISVTDSYMFKWQNAMDWAKRETPSNSVFAAWWDYGYWIQTLGQRTTILDPGNAVAYWNHLMGRHVFTSTNEREALEFLYAHNVSYLIMDSSDLSHYPAISFIGSDSNYDRGTYIPIFTRQYQEEEDLLQYEKEIYFREYEEEMPEKNESILLYGGEKILSEDIIYEINGTRIFLPADKTFLVGIKVETNLSNSISKQPKGIFIYQNEQYMLPIRYASQGEEIIDFGKGLESTIYLVTEMSLPSGNEVILNFNGVLIYLDRKVTNSNFAKLYLFNKQSPYFTMVHSEQSLIVSEIKELAPDFDKEIVFFSNSGDILGPIKIWQITYPENIEFKEAYVSTKYPEELRFFTR